MYEMKRAGYEPQVRHTAGRAVEIKSDLTHKIGKKQKTVTYSIVTQHRDHDRINDDLGGNRGIIQQSQRDNVQVS